jgi:hypothetical protein
MYSTRTILASIGYWLTHVKPRSLADVGAVFEMMIHEIMAPLIQRARVINRHEQANQQYYFYASRTAFCIYGNVLITAILKEWWLLYGVLFILMRQVLWVALLWFVYSLDDNESSDAIHLAKNWVRRMHIEGQRILQGKDAMRLIFTGIMLTTSPTSFNYARYAIRFKMHEMNERMYPRHREKGMDW